MSGVVRKIRELTSILGAGTAWGGSGFQRGVGVMAACGGLASKGKGKGEGKSSHK